ncbi:tetratricopeptide repeat-containing protein [Seongchinamella unica]|uniref:Tetratricopeptide repeat-containing protein n=1 Tax=Seongchinamella unica TaxID=2547392 RepID=A0A4R5LP27_9GAMM|nr:tetratricopeptide repeat protein [Seongchinamella unica]TDG12076.1 tetratricopeptide repeat-containing protein [Seongchinamella unica]
MNSWSVALFRGLVLALPGLALQAAPAPYGEDFVRTGAQWDEGGLAWLELSAKTTEPQDVEPFVRQVESLEQAGGPYADGLAEPLASLGRHYRQSGDYQQAVSLYRRAMHVVRINDGLGSARQIPLLRELLLSYRQAGDLEALDERYDYYFHLFGNGRPPFTPARLRAAREYMRWQREAVRLNQGASEKRLLELIELNEDILQAIQLQADVPYHWRRDFSYSQMLNHYLLLQRLEPTVSERQLLTSREYMGSLQAVQSLEDQKLDLRLRSAPARIAGMLEELAVAAAIQGPVEEAAVQLSLADWSFWTGNKRQAEIAYRQVVEILNGAGEDALLQQWLGEPVELPDNGVFWQAETAPDVATVTVEARYDVSALGRVSELQTRIPDGTDDRSLYRFRRKLLSTLFRPRWVTGEPEAVASIARHYRILD